MDDLLEVVTFSRAVMKIDIEGHERRAFYHADRLFDSIRVDYIFMEWIKLRALVVGFGWGSGRGGVRIG